MDWLHYFGMGSPYGDFLGKYAERVHQDRWQANYEAIALNVDQAERIRSFVVHRNARFFGGSPKRPRQESSISDISIVTTRRRNLPSLSGSMAAVAFRP
jgi:hypothetical protein